MCPISPDVLQLYQTCCISCWLDQTRKHRPKHLQMRSTIIEIPTQTCSPVLRQTGKKIPDTLRSPVDASDWGFGVFPPQGLLPVLAEQTGYQLMWYRCSSAGLNAQLALKFSRTQVSMLTAWPWHVSVVPCEGFIAAVACYCPSNTTLAFCAKEQGEGVLFGLFLSLWIHCALCVCF